MAVPTDRQTFINYIMRQLGEPVIKVNVAKEQVDDRVDQALYTFYERHYQAVEQIYILHDIQAGEVTQGYITLPDEIVGVADVFRPYSNATTWVIDNSLNMTDLYGLSTYYSTGNIGYYAMQRMNMDLLYSLFSPAKSYDFNYLTHKLVIAGGLADSENVYGGVVIKAFRKIMGENGDTDTPVYNIWRERWLQDYATALVKKQWSQNLSKYQSIQLLGGVSMNAAELKQEAEQEIQKLEQQLDQEFSLPVLPIVG